MKKSLHDPELLHSIRPEFMVHGNDWQNGSAALQKFRQDTIDMVGRWGGQVLEPQSTPFISTTAIIDAIYKFRLSKETEANAKVGESPELSKDPGK